MPPTDRRKCAVALGICVEKVVCVAGYVDAAASEEERVQLGLRTEGFALNVASGD